MSAKHLAEACTGKNYIRSNCFSDTYRAEVNIKGTKVLRDIVHISIPFDPVKEEYLKKRYGFDDDRLYEYYSVFAENLKKSWEIEDAVTDRENDEDDYVSSLRKSHLFREDLQIIKKDTERGSDVFIQYPVTYTFEEVTGITAEGGGRKNILMLGIRLLQIYNTEFREDTESYYFDPDILVSEAPGTVSGLKSLSFMYSGNGDINTVPAPNLKNRVRITAFKAAETRAKLDAIEKRLFSSETAEGYDSDKRSQDERNRDELKEVICSFGGKIYPGAQEAAIARMIWLMLGGIHCTSDTDCNDIDPLYASPALKEALRSCIKDKNPDADALIVALKQELDTRPDVYISFDPPQEENTGFTPALHIGDEILEEEEKTLDAIDDEEDAFLRNEYEKGTGTGDALHSRKKIVETCLIVSATIGLIAFVLFYILPAVGIFSDGKNSQDGMYSCEMNMYNLDGEVVDRDGSVAELYKISENGDITYGGETVFSRQYVSAYPVIESIQANIVSQEFQTYPSLSDYPYRDGIAVISSNTAYSYLEESGTVSLPEQFVKDNDIKGKSCILLAGGAEDFVLRITGDGLSDSEIPGNITFPAVSVSVSISRIRQGTQEELERALSYDEAAEEYGDGYLKGKWTYILRIVPSPEGAFNKDLIICLPESNGYGIKVNGEDIAGDYITIPGDELESTLITVTSVVEGPCKITVKAAVGSFEMYLPITFPDGERETEKPQDTETFEDPSGDEVYTPEPAATPSPVVTVNNTESGQYRSSSASEETQATVKEPEIFSADTDSLSLTAGQTAEVGTTGDDGGFIQVYSDDTTVATVKVTNGIDGAYTVTAIGKGICRIIFRSASGESVVTVTVV